ncbi:MAG: hypothetical protein GY770_07080 [Aestuariibacter sp.]|nr:hypothetical protein [Aestuariibacter sp.]
MQLILRFSIPVQKGNEAASDGTMGQALKELVEIVKPAAAYFHLDDGCRAGTIVFEASDPSQMAAVNEPLFAKLNAKIDIQPVISLDELLDKIGSS